jgi:5'-nucleotidase
VVESEHRQPYIFVTNDDGIQAPGLLALKQALEAIGETVVLAPNHGRSAAGHAKTMHKPLRIEQVTMADGSPAYASSGTPSDCVALAVLGFLERLPDLIVSGINQGSNVGHDITYSGTVSAAMEGVIAGIPSIAVSLDAYDGYDCTPAARFAARIARHVLANGLPKGVLLNVNVPALPESEILGVRVTRLGLRVYRDELVIRQDPRGRNYYWIGGQPPTGIPEEGTDIWALQNGYVSLTPLHMDMTAYDMLQAMSGWDINSI